MSILLSIAALLIINAEVPAKVSFLMGKVTIGRGGKIYLAVLNTSLYVDDIITTDSESECEIQFSNYSLVHLEPNSSIKIERKEKTKQGVFHRIFASIGEIVTKVTTLNKGDEYEVRTDAAQAFIRGTTFKTNIDQDGTSSFSVYEGSISIKGVLEGAKEILLNENFTSKIEKGAFEPFIAKLSELEITSFTNEFKDFIGRGAILDSLRNTIEKKIEEEKKDLIEKGKDKFKRLFK